MHKVIVDREKCIGCGLCKEDCVGNNILLVDGKAQIKRGLCIFCGHCEAICPQHAITINGFQDEPEEFEKETRLDPETLLSAIKTRRSIRSFVEGKAVPENVVKDILEAGRLAPTGSNSQNISYVVIREKKEECEGYAVQMFRTLQSAAKPLSSYIRNMEIDDHFFFKKAPLVIAIVSNSAVNASLAAENMCFMAEAHGLGVLYSGFFTMCANRSRKIRKTLGLEKGMKVVTTLVLGYPKVHYKRTVRRNEAKILWK